jgi:methionine-rich copper-binding protein CopC
MTVRRSEDLTMRRHARTLIAAAATLALLAVPAAAAAHVELVSSTPAAGDNLDTTPTEVTVTFDDELDPDRSGFTVTDAGGNEVGNGEVDLTVADRNVLTGAVTITDPGVYTVTYTVAGLDGHEVEGTLSFGYNADEEIPGPTGGEEHEGPDTALPAPELPLTAVGGALLLGLAAALAVRRLALR